jgi:hypothetical protein
MKMLRFSVAMTLALAVGGVLISTAAADTLTCSFSGTVQATSGTAPGPLGTSTNLEASGTVGSGGGAPCDLASPWTDQGPGVDVPDAVVTRPTTSFAWGPGSYSFTGACGGLDAATLTLPVTLTVSDPSSSNSETYTFTLPLTGGNNVLAAPFWSLDLHDQNDGVIGGTVTGEGWVTPGADCSGSFWEMRYGGTLVLQTAD